MKKQLPLILLIFIILFAAYIRLYNISSYMEFLGDEGRDVLIAKDILNGKFTLLGPRSSAGDFFMGPFYYYLITPFLWLTNYDPVGPAIMVALFGVATVFLIYKVASIFFKRMTGQPAVQAGLFASMLYSISPLILTYSHSSWNPNVLPFFALSLIYTVYMAVNAGNSRKLFFISGILLGICLQLHYLSLFLAAIITIYILLSHWFTHHAFNIDLLKKYLTLLIGTLISLSPLIIFEIRHNFLNTKGIITLFLSDSLNYSPDANFFTTISSVFFRIFARLILNFPVMGNTSNFSQLQLLIWSIAALILAFSSLIVLFKQKNKSSALLLSLWLFISVLLFGLYKKEIFDYLFTFIFPLPFLLIGNLLGHLYDFSKKKRLLFISLSIAIFSIISIISLLDIPIRYGPNNQRNQVKKIAQFVISKTNNQPYNFALLSKGNSDHAYRYYFDILQSPPVNLENLENDPKRESATRQLFIVCEDTDCNPIGNPLHDIAAFGRAEITDVWDVSVVKVFRLIPYLKK